MRVCYKNQTLVCRWRVKRQSRVASIKTKKKEINVVAQKKTAGEPLGAHHAPQAHQAAKPRRSRASQYNKTVTVAWNRESKDGRT